MTTSLVIGEVTRFLLMKTGESILGIQNWPHIQSQFRAKPDLAREMWQAAQQGLDYIDNLTRSGLSIVDIRAEDYRLAVPLATKFQLFGPDAVFAYHCQLRGIAHIASNDADFDRVPFLTRWKPEQDTSGTAAESAGDP